MECPQCHVTVSDSSVRCPACLADLPGAVPTVLHARGEVEVLDGKWALEKKLGQGGMGTVFLAHDVELDRRVAIKMMALSLADNVELVTRFEREARIMAKLEHPNVVPVYAVGRREGTPYIVMKYLEGLSLQDYLKARGRLPLGEVLWVTQQACDGLQFIHDRGVVHRDIKPGNIFLAPNGHVTLLDLGVAHDTKHVMTRSGVIVGTPRYMAPEQVLGKRVDYRADLYALATVIFEMLTGGPVFQHDSDYSIMRAQIDEPPPSPASRADVPETLTPVLTRALAKDPAERYPSALALADALAEAIGHDVKPVRPQPVPDAPAWAKGPTPPPEPSRATPDDPQQAVGTLERRPVTPTRAAPPEAPEVPPTRIDPPSGARSALQPVPGPVPQPAAARASALSTAERASVRGRAPALWVGGGLVAAALVAVAVTRPWMDEPAPAAEPVPALRVDAERSPKVPAPAEVVVPGAERPAEPRAVEAAAPVEAAKARGATADEPARGPVAPVVATASPRPAGAASGKTATVRDGELRLVVTSTGKLSWAYVDLDGLRQGTTPLTVRVSPGAHTLVFHRDGFESETRKLEVKPGETKKLSVELSPAPRAW